MRRICTLFVVFLLSFVVNVNADTLVLETNNGIDGISLSNVSYSYKYEVYVL